MISQRRIRIFSAYSSLSRTQQGEVEKRPGGEEVEADQDGGRGQEIERQRRPAGEVVHRGVGAERRDEAEHLAAGVDEPGPRQLPKPRNVGSEHAEVEPEHDGRGPHGHRAHQHRNAGLRQVGVFAEADRGRAEGEDHAGEDQHGHRLVDPPGIHCERGHGDERCRPRPAAARSDRAAARRRRSCHRRGQVETVPQLSRNRRAAAHATGAERVHQRAADHHAVGQPSDRRGLLRRSRCRTRPRPEAPVASRTRAIDRARSAASALLAPVTPSRATR